METTHEQLKASLQDSDVGISGAALSGFSEELDLGVAFRRSSQVFAYALNQEWHRFPLGTGVSQFPT